MGFRGVKRMATVKHTRPWRFYPGASNMIVDANDNVVLHDTDYYPSIVMSDEDWQLVVDLINAAEEKKNG